MVLLNNDVEVEPDWLAVVRGLRAAQTELWEDPDVERILEYCSEPSPCLDRDGSAITNLANQGHHAVNFTSVEPLSAELVDTSDDAPWDEATYVTVRVSGVVPVFPPDAAVVDAAGAFRGDRPWPR